MGTERGAYDYRRYAANFVCTDEEAAVADEKFWRNVSEIVTGQTYAIPGDDQDARRIAPSARK